MVSLLYVLASLPVIYLALPPVLARMPRVPQFVLKSLTVLMATLIMSVLGCFVSIVCAMLNKRYAINYIVARLFAYLAARPCGVTYRVVGEEKLEQSPAVVVCNHQSSMDMMVLGRVFPKHTVVMAKKELLYFPFLGMYMKLSNAIFIDRKNHKKALESTAQAVADMKKHNSGIWIFPEGTRSRLDTADLLPFKKGAFHLAIQAQIPVQPIVAQGYSHIYDSTKRAFPGGELEIRVLDPIPTTGMTAENVNELMEKTRNMMLKHLKEMDEQHKKTAKKEGAIAGDSTTSASSSAIASTVDGEEGLKKRRTQKD